MAVKRVHKRCDIHMAVKRVHKRCDIHMAVRRVHKRCDIHMAVRRVHKRCDIHMAVRRVHKRCDIHMAVRRVHKRCDIHMAVRRVHKRCYIHMAVLGIWGHTVTFLRWQKAIGSHCKIHIPVKGIGTLSNGCRRYRAHFDIKIFVEWPGKHCEFQPVTEELKHIVTFTPPMMGVGNVMS